MVRDYAPVAPVVTDRHKFLQIMVNLLSNACHAVKAAKIDQGRVCVRIRDVAEGVSITVADNGIGIAAEDLTKVFQHGFTTRSDGHGFGLHSAANAATELGGRLSGTSDGAGMGARFTVELPRRSSNATVN